MNKKGLLIVYAGPSGVGKGTIMKEMLVSDDNLKLSVSATTRSKRENEVEGVDYYYISDEAFDKMIENNEFLEHAEYCGHKYGTPKKPVFDMMDKGIDVILEIEVEGYKQIKQMFPDCVSIFILPPSRDDLLNRLRNRGTESKEDIEKRVSQAEYELSQANKFDYKVINEDVKSSTYEILSIIHDIKNK